MVAGYTEGVSGVEPRTEWGDGKKERKKGRQEGTMLAQGAEVKGVCVHKLDTSGR